MRDIERILRDALRRQGEGYEPRDPYGARAAFVERLRRRRRVMYLRAGGAFVAAVLLAVLVVPGTLTEPEPGLELAGVTPEVVATIPVGGAPTASAAAPDGSVWVATGRDVVAIDPEVNGVVRSARTPGQSDEVAVAEDHVWVSTREGYLLLIDPQSGSMLARANVPRAQPLDIAARADSLWAVGMNDGRLYTTDASSGFEDESLEPDAVEDGEPGKDLSLEQGGGGLSLSQETFPGMPLTDVAVGDAGLWVLFRSEDSAGVFQVDPDDMTGQTPIPVEVGANADLAVGLHAVWLATGTKGTVERIDARTGQITASVEVGGRYTDIAVGEGVVWAITGGDGPSRLYQIGADGEFIGEPLELEGDPVDVAVGAGAVWVSDQANGDILRIEPQPRDEDPTPQATLTPEARAEDAILYVYATGGESGDLHAQRASGEIDRLTMTPDVESNPAIAPDGKSILFERDDFETDNPIVLIYHDLETGEEQLLAEGSDPAFATDGRVAFVQPIEDSPSEGSFSVVIGKVIPSERKGLDVAFEETLSFVVDGAERDGLRNLHWEHDGEALYFETHWEGWVTNQVNLDAVSNGDRVEPFVLHPDQRQPGLESVVSTGAVVTGIDVLSLCCPQDGGDTAGAATVGRIHFTEGGAEYMELLPTAQLPSEFQSESAVQVFAALRGWSASLDGSWECCGPQGWLLGDGTNLWWLDEGRQDPVLIESAANVESVGVNPSIEQIHPVSLGGS